MKKLVLSFLLIFLFIAPMNKAQAMDPKGKAFMIICTYGTVGGALLGFATMAFGTNSRAIAQGASLGLYAGIAFGSYVISSHRKNGEEDLQEPAFNGPGQQPPPAGGPGFEQGPGGGFGQDPGGYGEQPPSDGGGFFGTPQRFIEINDDLVFNYKLKNNSGRKISPPVYINLFQAVF